MNQHGMHHDTAVASVLKNRFKLYKADQIQSAYPARGQVAMHCIWRCSRGWRCGRRWGLGARQIGAGISVSVHDHILGCTAVLFPLAAQNYLCCIRVSRRGQIVAAGTLHGGLPVTLALLQLYHSFAM